MQATPTGFERRISLDGCFNFRDLGGYRTRDGRVVRPQLVYRADGPHALTDRDADKLRALELATVLDLRTPQEAADRGCYVRVLADVVEYHLPMVDVLPDTNELPRWVDPRVVATRYREMLEQGRDAVAEALAILADPGAYPAMFHCSAGKDRTGVLAALLLGLLGVADEVIVTDYELSAAAMERLIAHFRRTHPDAREQLARVAPAMVSAHPDAMAMLLDGIRRDYGSYDGYADAIGVGAAAGYIRSALLT